MSSSQPLQVEVLDGDILTVIVHGDLDTLSTPEFDRVIKSHLDQGHSRIIIDCRWLGYLSSLAIGSLVALQTRLKRKGGAVKLCAIQGPVMKLIKAVRLDHLLDIYGDLEFARQAFSQETLAVGAVETAP
jgi:anti-anti-sigma factor